MSLISPTPVSQVRLTCSDWESDLASPEDAVRVSEVHTKSLSLQATIVTASVTPQVTCQDPPPDMTPEGWCWPNRLYNCLHDCCRAYKDLSQHSCTVTKPVLVVRTQQQRSMCMSTLRKDRYILLSVRLHIHPVPPLWSVDLSGNNGAQCPLLERMVCGQTGVV